MSPDERHGEAPPTRGMIDVRLVQLPIGLHLSASQHIDGLAREFRWLDAGPTDTPVRVLKLGARVRKRSDAVMGPLNAIVNAAHERGETAVDLAFEVPPQAADLCRSVMDLLDEADEFCRSGGLLTLATPPDALEYRRWFLGEFVRQVAGEEPVAWPESTEAAALTDVDS